MSLRIWLHYKRQQVTLFYVSFVGLKVAIGISWEQYQPRKKTSLWLKGKSFWRHSVVTHFILISKKVCMRVTQVRRCITSTSPTVKIVSIFGVLDTSLLSYFIKLLYLTLLCLFWPTFLSVLLSNLENDRRNSKNWTPWTYMSLFRSTNKWRHHNLLSITTLKSDVRM